MTARLEQRQPTSDEAGATSADPERRDGLPRWLALPLAVTLALVLAACVVGVVAAILESFRPAVVAVGTVAVGAPAALAAVRAVPRGRSSRSAHAAAAAVLLAVAGITAWNALEHGQHVVADRDPGVYLTTARHLMDEGDVLVPGPVGPFVDAPGVSANGAGFSNIRDDGTLEPQFPHLTAVVLAMGGWVGELGLFVMTPAVAGLGLVLLYAWASTVIGPRWSGLATVIAGLTMPFTMFARDAYSEPITTVLVFGGLWLLHLAARGPRDPWLWLVAGLTLGATNMARVDSFLYVAPITLAVVLWLRLEAPGERRRTAAQVAACTAGVVATSAIGLWDTLTLTGGYFHASLGPRLPGMLGAAVAAGVAAWFGAPRLWRRAGAAATLVPTRLLQRLMIAFALTCAGFFAWGYWLRPDPEGIPATAVEGVNILSYLPQAATLSMRWLEWYFGPIGLVAGLGGLLVCVIVLTRNPGRPDPGVVAGLAAIFVTLLLYLWSPSITPDQPWAMRRFAAVALPGLAVGIGATCRALWQLGGASRPRRTLAAGLAALVAIGALASTAAITWPTREVRAQVPMRARMHEICDHLQPDDVVLVTIDGILALMASVPVGVWCDVPSAGGTALLEPETVARLAVEWEAEGRRLVVLSSSETPLFNTLRPAGIVTRAIHLEPIHPTAIEPTLTSRPDEVVPDGRLGKGPDGELTFHLYVIDPDRARTLLRTSQREASTSAAEEAPSAGRP